MTRLLLTCALDRSTLIEKIVLTLLKSKIDAMIIARTTLIEELQMISWKFNREVNFWLESHDPSQVH